MARVQQIGLVIALGLAACDEVSAPLSPGSDSQIEIGTSVVGDVTARPDPGTFTVADPLDPAVSEMRNRWIGIKNNPRQDCPDPAGTPYQLSVLFELGVGPQPPPGLEQFCLYVAPVVAGGQPPFPNPSAVGFRALGPDHAAVTQHARRARRTDLMRQMYSEEYSDLFALEGGAMPDLRRSSAPTTRVAVIDSSPTEAPGSGHLVRGTDDHGFAMANYIRHLLCAPGGGCIGRVSTRLALPLRYEMGTLIEDTVNGGDFGTVLQLAEAIQLETADWLTDGVADRLVINLSLGWHPAYGGEGSDPTLWPPDVQAVYSALEYARCQGALIIAASGNDAGSPNPDAAGPIYPAGWEMLEVRAAGCQAASGGTYPIATDVHGRPLVHAAGAVNEANVEIAIARPESRPPLVAYGDHAAAPDPTSTGGFTKIYTGTSVSAAVVSAAAAAVWSNLRPLSAGAVMEQIADSSTAPLGPADAYFCSGPFCPETLRVEVCEAVKYACEAGPYAGTCTRVPPVLACDTSPPFVPQADPAELATFLAITPEVDLVMPWAPRVLPPLCGASELYSRRFIPDADPCPLQQHYVAEQAAPLTLPQPHNTACPVCQVSVSTGEVVIEQEAPLDVADSMTLILQHATGPNTEITSTVLPPTNRVVFNLSPTLTADTVAAKVTAMVGAELYYSEMDVLP